MGREIKFRAWSDEMYYDVGCAKGVAVFTHNCMPVFDGVIMQYTGLKDKNGKEIYEGDVVRAFDSRLEKSYNLTVVWDQDACSSGWTLSGIGWHQDELEVIGNIYEDPHLLK